MKPEELKAIRKRHADAAYLSETIPEIRAAWESDEVLDDSDIVRAFRSSYSSRWSYSVNGITFALHAHDDMTALLAHLDKLEGKA